MKYLDLIRNKINARQAVVLLRLKEYGGDASPSSLSCDLISKATMTDIIDNFVERGVATREHSRSDRRKNIIRLTPKGESLCLQLEGSQPE